MKPKKLTKKEEKKLQEQFPKIDKNIKARIQNKLEMIVILFGLSMLVGVLYLFYLVWNYEFIGVW